MPTDFLHGVEVVTLDSGIRPIATVRSAVIGLIGTAPAADALAFPLDTPVLVNSRAGYATIGATGTLKDALDGIFDQFSPFVVVIRVAEGANANEAMANVIGSVDVNGVRKGVQAFRDSETLLGLSPMLLIAPGFTGTRPTGVSAVGVGGGGGSGYTSAPTVAFTGGGGLGATAHAVLGTGGNAGKVTSIVVDNPGVGYTTAPTVALTGGGGTGATATATITAGPNPVVTALLALAEIISAHIFAEGPDTTDAAAIQYRGDWASRRIFVVDPSVKRYNAADGTYVNKPNSAVVAGLTARIDHEIGFWKSPSNEVVNGVGGLGRAVDWASGDPNTRANLLNSNEVATFIRDDGWRLWGNRTCSDDPIYAFLSVSRTKDMVDLSIKAAQRRNVDGVVNKAFFDDVAGSVNAYFRQLKTRGAVLGGECWYDPAKNTEADLAAGHVTFSYKFTPPPVAERLTFESAVTTDYLVSIFE